MDLTELIKMLAPMGPVGILALTTLFLAWHVLSERRKPVGPNGDPSYKQLLERSLKREEVYHEWIAQHKDFLVDITRSLERLATLIETWRRA